MSLDVRDKSIRLLSSPSGGRWFQPDTPEFSPINEDNEKVERKLSKFTERKVSSKDNLNDDRKSKIDESSLYNMALRHHQRNRSLLEMVERKV